jgi:hypothetical protein
LELVEIESGRGRGDEGAGGRAIERVARAKKAFFLDVAMSALHIFKTYIEMATVAMVRQ